MNDQIINERLSTWTHEVEIATHDIVAAIDEVALRNTEKVLNAFHEFRVSDVCFNESTGYGYDDVGRETLEKIYAKVFGTEDALVRINFVNGTHALTCALFALGEPGKTILSITGKPYDTLCDTIGVDSKLPGSLAYYGIGYQQINLSIDGGIDTDSVVNALVDSPCINAVLIQRSRGYEDRRALSISEIGRICQRIHDIRPDIRIMVDNCYGEFTETQEPTQAGADLIAGSLIKNPGGGVSPTGGYVAGKKELVQRAAMHLTTPGICGECGSTLGLNRQLYQGLFLAPHVTAQALKTAVFCAGMMEKAGFRTSPSSLETRHDIIQMVRLDDGARMKSFCKGIQAGSPVDSFVTPEPWQMPGYDCPVIMAAGAFIQGSSIELSADGPYKPPYILYIQGGLTYESGKLGILHALRSMLSDRDENKDT